MNKKLLLTSALAMGVIAPAFAEPSHTGTFPSGGLMQEDYTYTNAATSTNMDGVYEGTVNAVAEYENILYNIVAGNYLPGGSEETNGSQCTPGNFCTGLTNATYSESDQGLTSCSTLGDGSYTLSPAGATNGNMCYKTCSASCTNPTAPAHSRNVTYGHETSNGTWNYGSTCNAVAPTCSINFECVNGYHKRPDITREQAESVFNMFSLMQGEDPAEASESYKSMIIDYMLEWDSLSDEYKNQLQTVLSTLGSISKVEGLATNTNNGGVEIQNLRAYTYTKSLTGEEQCKSLTDDLFYGEIVNCNELQNSEISSFRQTAQNGDWFLVIPNRNITLAGRSRCLSEWTGSPCEFQYSSLDGQSATSSWYKDFTLDTWEFDVENGAHSASCIEACPSLAVGSGAYYLLLSSSIAIGEISVTGSSSRYLLDFISSVNIENPTNIQYMCSANTITINWNDVDPEYAGQNNEDTAKYDGDIKTPVKAATKKGKTFRGWRFVKPSNN